MKLFSRPYYLGLVLFCGFVKILQAAQDTGSAVANGIEGRQSPHKNSWMWDGRLHQNDLLYQNTESSENLNGNLFPDFDDDAGADPETDNSNPASTRVYENECPICYLRREEAKQMRLENIKRTILDQLGMTHPPNISTKPVLPRSVELTRIIYQYLRGDMQSDQPQSTVLSRPVTRLEEVILFPKKGNQNTSYVFTFDEKLHNYDVQSALLHIHIHRRSYFEVSSAYYVLLCRVFEPPSGSLNPKIQSVIRKKFVTRPLRGKWVTLNLTQVVQDWFDHPEEHNVIQLSLVDNNGSPHDDILDTYTDSSYQKRSFLMVSVREKRDSRPPRSVEDPMTCTEGSPVTTCCRYPMTIDFEAMGWDNWIIAPKIYDAFVCGGECSWHSVEGPMGPLTIMAVNSRECCSPRRMTNLKMIYHDVESGDIRLEEVQNMVVESCHCV